MSKLDLTAIRAKIDDVDTQIQTLITQRANLAKEVAQAKYAEEKQPNFYRPEREAEILRQVIQRNQGVLPDETLTLIFQEIMSACRAVQKPIVVAFLGPAGTYSQTAVFKHFGHSIQTIAAQTIEDVFHEVEIGNAEYGVVPIENSTEGGVNQTLDCFVKTTLKVCGEIDLPIHHCLLAMTQDRSSITRIYAHQQSFAQCRAWLNANMPSIERITVNSNAEAARRASNEIGTAAIAGETAAEIYHLHVLSAHIEDHVHNTTRFVVLGKQDIPATGQDKTSLYLSLPNKMGSLYHLLECFVKNAINMSKIESRPSRQTAWDYVLFVDIEGHIQDTTVSKAIQELQAQTAVVKHLGSYPRVLR
ncbi:prephenate dehydratase [Beggiatoa leptomitoformis]|uniref:Bifunctional chorismate mutase/prephenate dehydratase n=1 Tax=Beggiatoa leptomitoformis TaxID=288004 RepID=A0A2N9YG21_9GAMM|nr:prephenate dehydratase [Beggiatoa leptomitoformis]ALG68227.1 prephenate dehydratase [Beggiatoa leptomitoformis]AUI69468.1 prephenate dehydratase [Beggiatoa leptomitoformis]